MHVQNEDISVKLGISQIDVFSLDIFWDIPKLNKNRWDISYRDIPSYPDLPRVSLFQMKDLREVKIYLKPKKSILRK